MYRLLLACMLLLPAFASGQSYSVSGTVLDPDRAPVINGYIQLRSSTDTSQVRTTITDTAGVFRFEGLTDSSYVLSISYVGTDNFRQQILLRGADRVLDTIRLRTASGVLQEVVVQGQVARAVQQGDTTSFNAGAFKTNPDATTEDLLTKMPGVTSDNTGVKVNGETVKQVLVDGKPFFGDDPSVAMKNLPAEVIDKIQVFDRLSDQSQFSGFDDGNSQKTINIITKKGKNNGQFGRVSAGYGTDNRYTVGGNINLFNGNRRISIIGLSNNINQQNFSTEDLLGVSSGNSGRGGLGGASGRGQGGGRNGYGGGGGDASNFLVGQQAGITTTHSIGLNYSDDWGKKVKVTAGYFYNNTENVNATSLSRRYFTAGDSGLIYNESSNTVSRNVNHRGNFRLEYTIDSNNAIILTSRLSVQDNDYSTVLEGNSTRLSDIPVSRISNRNGSRNTGYNFNTNLLYRHQFGKRGRTISLNLNPQFSSRDGDGTIYSLNEYFNSDTTLLDQVYELRTNGNNLSGSVNYTEPLGRKSQLSVNYTPSFSENNSNRATYDLDPNNESVRQFDTLLSNKYRNTYNTQRGGLSYRYNDEKVQAMVGVQAQEARLEGFQEFPYAYTLDRPFRNVLPQAMLNYKFDKSTNLRLFYRTATNPPSVSQLQDVVDVTNPLLLRTGNTALVQSYDHSINLRYGKTQGKGGRSFFLFGSASVTKDYIGNQTLIPTRDSVYREGILIRTGSQLSRPVNLDGYRNGRLFATLSFPIAPIKCNLNLSPGISYTRTPALINQTLNISESYTPNMGIVLSSNISEDFDFTLAYNGSYSDVHNSLQQSANNSYYTHNASLRLNYIYAKRLVFNTNLNQTVYSGLTQSFNQQFLLWNAYVGYKLLKDRSLEARLSAYDLLNQNKSISRNVTDVYIEDTKTQVLTQYFMFSLTYTLRRFKGMSAPQPDLSAPGNMPQAPGNMPPPGGMRPPGGGGGMPPY